ncbi:MAG: DUF6048 family protein [Bacteroidota bacterium]
MARRLLVVFFSVLTASYGLAQVDSLSVPAMDSLSAVPAQSDSVLLAMDSTAATTVEAAALVIPKRPFNIGIHVDYGKILTLPFPFEYKVEGGLTLEFLERIELVGELGYWEKDARRAIDNGTYTSTGMYLRAGAGFIVPFNQPGSQIGLGFRYGISNFSDEGRYEISETGGLIEPFASSFSRDNLSATWMSGVLTSMSSLKIRKALPDARINRVFKIGLMLRYRFLIGWDRRLSPDDPIDVFTIPGFGRTLSQRNLALNAFIRIYPFGY